MRSFFRKIQSKRSRRVPAVKIGQCILKLDTFFIHGKTSAMFPELIFRENHAFRAKIHCPGNSVPKRFLRSLRHRRKNDFLRFLRRRFLIGNCRRRNGFRFFRHGDRRRSRRRRRCRKTRRSQRPRRVFRSGFFRRQIIPTAKEQTRMQNIGNDKRFRAHFPGKNQLPFSERQMRKIHFRTGFLFSENFRRKRSRCPAAALCRKIQRGNLDFPVARTQIFQRKPRGFPLTGKFKRSRRHIVDF